MRNVRGVYAEGFNLKYTVVQKMITRKQCMLKIGLSFLAIDSSIIPTASLCIYIVLNHVASLLLPCKINQFISVNFYQIAATTKG